MTRIAIVTVLGLLATSAAFAQSPPVGPGTPAEAEAGRRAFMDYACFYCHGTVGQGSLPAVGPRIARLQRSLESFRSYVRRPSGRMSAYSEAMISDGTLAEMYAYLKSVPEPTAPRPALIELLRKR